MMKLAYLLDDTTIEIPILELAETFPQVKEIVNRI